MPSAIKDFFSSFHATIFYFLPAKTAFFMWDISFSNLYNLFHRITQNFDATVFNVLPRMDSGSWTGIGDACVQLWFWVCPQSQAVLEQMKAGSPFPYRQQLPGARRCIAMCQFSLQSNWPNKFGSLLKMSQGKTAQNKDFPFGFTVCSMNRASQSLPYHHISHVNGSTESFYLLWNDSQVCQSALKTAACVLLRRTNIKVLLFDCFVGIAEKKVFFISVISGKQSRVFQNSLFFCSNCLFGFG